MSTEAAFVTARLAADWPSVSSPAPDPLTPAHCRVALGTVRPFAAMDIVLAVAIHASAHTDLSRVAKGPAVTRRAIEPLMLARERETSLDLTMEELLQLLLVL